MRIQLEGSMSMELSGAPPARISAGRTLPQPMVVRMLASGSNNAYSDATDLNGVWAYVSLVSPDRRESLAPPREDLFRGKKAISIRPVSQGQVIGYAEFADLAVLQPGKYCFRINIVGMGR